MILHTTCEKVGHRQAPIKNTPNFNRWGCFALEITKSIVLEFVSAGLPALQGGESGQVRKEAATATYCKCRGLGSPLSFF